MKKDLLDMYFSRLGNERHLQFHISIDTHVTESEADAMDTKLAELYREAIKNETAALDYITASALTTGLNTADSRRKRLLRGFINAVESAVDHYDEAICADAVAIRNVIKHYGNINRRTHDAQTAAIDDLARELTAGVYAPMLERLKVRDRLDEAVAANAAYQSLAMERFDETALRTPFRMKTCRPETDRIYYAIANEIENRVLKGETMPGMTEFIAKWNAIVAHYKNISRHIPADDTGNNSPEEA